ncbi:ras-related protein Rap-2a [Neocloeon triangulifer]|uniref:ras-related protein Rap-2a n=1 Tax=Neocloeon triangulifer TaxID=2078957 RepID=UPI00286F40C2|nr:ras-related protein Rap-2a [Neocloeon triangulifer]
MPTMAPPGSTRSIRQFKRRFSLQPSSFLGRDDGGGTPRGGHSPSIDECSATKDIVTKHRHKIVVMGPTKSGKTSLISQFLYGTFPDRYKRTVEEMHHGEFDVGGVHLTLDILDTSGAQEFPAMRALSISSADAFILVYALDESEESFEEVRQLRDLILSTKGASGVPIVVIGNKLDLVEDSSEVAESIVTLDWEHGYVQASAKDNRNVAKCFQELLNQAKVKYNLSPALRQRRRRQSLPAASGSSPSHKPTTAAIDAEKLEKMRQVAAATPGEKRNSCVIS